MSRLHRLPPRGAEGVRLLASFDELVSHPDETSTVQRGGRQEAHRGVTLLEGLEVQPHPSGLQEVRRCRVQGDRRLTHDGVRQARRQ